MPCRCDCPHGRLGGAGSATKLGRACTQDRLHAAAVGGALRKAVAATLVTLVAAHYLPWELESMVRQRAGRIGLWAGSSARTGTVRVMMACQERRHEEHARRVGAVTTHFERGQEEERKMVVATEKSISAIVGTCGVRRYLLSDSHIMGATESGNA